MSAVDLPGYVHGHSPTTPTSFSNSTLGESSFTDQEINRLGLSVLNLEGSPTSYDRSTTPSSSKNVPKRYSGAPSLSSHSATRAGDSISSESALREGDLKNFQAGTSTPSNEEDLKSFRAGSPPNTERVVNFSNSQTKPLHNQKIYIVKGKAYLVSNGYYKIDFEFEKDVIPDEFEVFIVSLKAEYTRLYVEHKKLMSLYDTINDQRQLIRIEGMWEEYQNKANVYKKDRELYYMREAQAKLHYTLKKSCLKVTVNGAIPGLVFNRNVVLVPENYYKKFVDPKKSIDFSVEIHTKLGRPTLFFQGIECLPISIKSLTSFLGALQGVGNITIDNIEEEIEKARKRLGESRCVIS